MKYVILYFLLCFIFTAKAQHYDNNFILGNIAANTTKLSFNNNSIQVDTNFTCNNLPFTSSALTMSDANGDLLFYTNGIYVHNANC